MEKEWTVHRSALSSHIWLNVMHCNRTNKREMEWERERKLICQFTERRFHFAWCVYLNPLIYIAFTNNFLFWLKQKMMMLMMEKTGKINKKNINKTQHWLMFRRMEWTVEAEDYLNYVSFGSVHILFDVFAQCLPTEIVNCVAAEGILFWILLNNC